MFMKKLKKTEKSILKNQKGFTLFEVVFSAALLAIFMAGIPEMLKSVFTIQEEMEKSMHTGGTSSLIRTILGDTARCTDALKSQNVTKPITIYRKITTLNQPKPVIAAPGSPAGGPWKIKNIFFDNMALDYTDDTAGLAVDNATLVAGDNNNFQILLSKWNDLANYLTFQNGNWYKRSLADHSVVKKYDNETQYMEFGTTTTQYLPRVGEPLLFHHSGYFLTPDKAQREGAVKFEDAFSTLPVQILDTTLNVEYENDSKSSFSYNRSKIDRFNVEIAVAGPNVVYCSNATGKSENLAMTTCARLGGLWNKYIGKCDQVYPQQIKELSACLQIGQNASLININGSTSTKCLAMLDATCYSSFFQGLFEKYKGDWGTLLLLASGSIGNFQALRGLGKDQCAGAGI